MPNFSQKNVMHFLAIFARELYFFGYFCFHVHKNL